MGFRRYLAGQLRWPGGIVGRGAGLLMRRVKRDKSDWTLSLLKVRPADHVLEVGYGPGLAVQRASEMAPEGRVAGVDFSETMYRQAAKRNAAAVAEGRVDLRVGDAAALPYAGGAFDKAFAVNVIYFWPEPGKVLEEFRRILRPGGRLAIYRATREALEAIGLAQTGVFAVYGDEELERMLAGAGFRRVRFAHKSFGKGEKDKSACALTER